jgi:hypothetical protein
MTANSTTERRADPRSIAMAPMPGGVTMTAQNSSTELRAIAVHGTGPPRIVRHFAAERKQVRVVRV